MLWKCFVWNTHRDTICSSKANHGVNVYAASKCFCMFSPHNADFRAKRNSTGSVFLTFALCAHTFSLFISTPNFWARRCCECLRLELWLIVVNHFIWFKNIKVIEFHLNFHISFSFCARFLFYIVRLSLDVPLSAPLKWNFGKNKINIYKMT